MNILIRRGLLASISSSSSSRVFVLMTRSMYNRTTENNTLHPKAIQQEPEDERKDYEKFVQDLGSSRFIKENEDSIRELPIRNYQTSTEEWKYVERLITVDEIVPPIPKRDSYPSGFVPPKALEKRDLNIRYHVRRTKNHFLPVYVKFDALTRTMTTRIRLADGDLFQLRSDLDEFLFQRYQMSFVSQVAELFGRVMYRGDFERDFKEFLLEKGF